jgi:FtsP/CotA-like multicopper oxidase with cupredoxin domain
VYAFAEESKAPQIPGPLIRVPEGVEMRVVLRNLLPSTATVHGLHEHSMDAHGVVELLPGTERELRFTGGGGRNLPVLGQHLSTLEPQPPWSAL